MACCLTLLQPGRPPGGRGGSRGSPARPATVCLAGPLARRLAGRRRAVALISSVASIRCEALAAVQTGPLLRVSHLVSLARPTAWLLHDSEEHRRTPPTAKKIPAWIGLQEEDRQEAPDSHRQVCTGFRLAATSIVDADPPRASSGGKTGSGQRNWTCWRHACLFTTVTRFSCGSSSPYRDAELHPIGLRPPQIYGSNYLPSVAGHQGSFRAGIAALFSYYAPRFSASAQ